MTGRVWDEALTAFSSLNTCWSHRYDIGQADIAERSWNRARAAGGTNAASTAWEPPHRLVVT
jgi:hypothetical protein